MNEPSLLPSVALLESSTFEIPLLESDNRHKFLLASEKLAPSLRSRLYLDLLAAQASKNYLGCSKIEIQVIELKDLEIPAIALILPGNFLILCQQELPQPNLNYQLFSQAFGMVLVRFQPTSNSATILPFLPFKSVKISHYRIPILSKILRL